MDTGGSAGLRAPAINEIVFPVVHLRPMATMSVSVLAAAVADTQDCPLEVNVYVESPPTRMRRVALYSLAPALVVTSRQ
jgi:hypothetical protein